MAVKTSWAAGDVLTAADLTDTFAAKANLAGATYTGTQDFTGATVTGVPSGLTLITSGSLTGTTVNINSIPATYRNLQLVVRNFKPATDAASLTLRYNADTNTRYFSSNAIQTTAQSFNATSIQLDVGNDNSSANGLIVVNVFDYANTTTWKMLTSDALANDSTTATSLGWVRRTGFYNQTGAISAINLNCSSGNFTSGDFLLYGMN